MVLLYAGSETKPKKIPLIPITANMALAARNTHSVFYGP